MNTSIPSWLATWARTGDRGISSETIAYTLLGVGGLLSRADAPYDTSDAHRCVTLLDLAAANGEDWRSRLHEVAAACPAWVPLVPRWPEIEAALAEDIVAQNAHAAFEREHPIKSKRKSADGKRLHPYPPSRCWWLVRTLRDGPSHDPYQHHSPHPFEVLP